EWADRFDGSLGDVFAFQDKVTTSIADALAVRLSAAERSAVTAQETKVPAAYDAFLRGWVHFRRTTAEDYAKAVPYFEEAVALDPDYGRAYAALTLIYARSAARDYAYALGLSAKQAENKAKEYLAKAQEQQGAVSHQAAGYLQMTTGDPESAVAEFKEAIAGDPGDSWNYAFMSWALTAAGRPAEGIPHIRTAMRLDPHYPSSFLFCLALAQFGMEQYADAASALERATAANPEDEYAFELLAATYGHLGRKAEGEAAVARYNGIRVARGQTPLTLDDIPSLLLRTFSDRNRLKKGLRLAGVPPFLLIGEFAEQNALSAEQARTLLFGHRLHGRSPWTGQENIASFTASGVVTASGAWTWTNGSTVVFRDDQLFFQGGQFS